MAEKMKTRDSRALIALAVAVGAFGLLQLDSFGPAADVSTSSDSIEQLESAFQLAQVKARQKPVAAAELATLEQALARLESQALVSATSELAQAEMRTLIGDLLAAEGIAMAGSRFGQIALVGDNYAEIPITVDFNCGIEQFVNLTTAVANSPRLLVTRRIRIRPGAQETKAVQVQLTVAGYLPAERTPDLTKSATGRAAGARL